MRDVLSGKHCDHEESGDILDLAKATDRRKRNRLERAMVWI